LCGTTHKAVKRIVTAALADQLPAPRRVRDRRYDSTAKLVRDKVAGTEGGISAKRLLPVATAAGYAGSARNVRGLVAAEKARWRRTRHRGRHHDWLARGLQCRLATTASRRGTQRGSPHGPGGPDALPEGRGRASVVVPTAGYARFATHYRFRPDFCEAADPESN
jgi:hypothetical protein